MNSKQRMLAAVMGGMLASLGFGVQSSQAALTLRFEDGADPSHFFSFTDTDGDGIVSYDGVSTLPGWNIKQLTANGISSAPGDTTGDLLLNVTQVENSSAGTRTLKIILTDDGYTLPGAIGGAMEMASTFSATLTKTTAGNQIIFRSYIDPDGAGPLPELSTAAQTIVSTGSMMQSIPDDVLTANFVRGSSYTIRQVAEITLSANGKIGFNGATEVSVIPEPTSFAAAAGLVSVLLMGRRRREIEA